MADVNAALQGRFQRDISQHLRWRNLSGESVPAYGVVRLTDYDTGNAEHQIAKPDGSEGLYYVNGPSAVANNARGASQTWDLPRLVLTDSGDTLAVGDQIGPVDGQWYMSSAGTGFRVFAAPNVNYIAAVERIGGGAGNNNTIRFQIHEADCEGRSIVARVMSYRGSVPEAYTIDGETELDELGATIASRFVPAYDKVGCYLNESNVNLVGRYGYATYLYGAPKYNYQPWLGWEVIALCEQQTECEAL